MIDTENKTLSLSGVAQIQIRVVQKANMLYVANFKIVNPALLLAV